MKQKRGSLIFAGVALTAIILLTSTSTAQTPAATSQGSTADQLTSLMKNVNPELEAGNAVYSLHSAEFLTPDNASEVGQTVFFNDRTKQFGSHFVPFDPRRGGSANITYMVDQAEGPIDGLTVAQTTAAIDQAMATWNRVNCSTIPITKVPDIPGLDIGLVENQLGLPGQRPFFLADITHAGWLPAYVLPPNVIGITFTFIFVDPATGAPTDIDNNGKLDVAFRETYYNDRFAWNINGDVDVQTVALHESGHGLSQDHFGKAFETANGKIHFAPLAVMNAAYSDVQQDLLGTDNAGHCSIWASWPNN